MRMQKSHYRIAGRTVSGSHSPDNILSTDNSLHKILVAVAFLRADDPDSESARCQLQLLHKGLAELPALNGTLECAPE